MPEITLKQIADAVEKLRATAAATVAALKLPDPSDENLPYPVIAPSAPTSPDQIAAAEAALGLRLPPSYRHFLTLHNGWDDVDLGSDLLSIGAVVDFNRSKSAKALEPILDEIERSSADGLIVFGTTKGDKSMFIFDSGKADKFGEWAVIDYDAEEGMLDEYDNFLEFLIDTAATLRMMGGGKG